MANPTSRPESPADTEPVLRGTTPTGLARVNRTNRGSLPPNAPGWKRAWRSCWPLAGSVVVLVTAALALVLEYHQARIYESVTGVRILSAEKESPTSLATQIHELRKLAEQQQRWDGVSAGLPPPRAPGLTVAETGTDGELELRLRGEHPTALEMQLRAVVSLHRQHLEARQEQMLEHRRQELRRAEDRLKRHQPAPASGMDETIQTARKILEQAELRREEIEVDLATARQAVPPEAGRPAPAVLEKMLRADPAGSKLFEQRLQKLGEREHINRVAVGAFRETNLRRLDREITEIESRLAGVQARLIRPSQEQEQARWEADRQERIAKLTEDLRRAGMIESAARMHLETVQGMPATLDSQAQQERIRLQEQVNRRAEEVRALEHRGGAGAFEVRGESTYLVDLWWRSLLTFAISLTAGLFLGGLVVAHQKAYGKVRDVSELSDITGQTVLGILPLVSGNAVPIPGVRPGGEVGTEIFRLEAAADLIRGPVLRQVGAGPVRLLVTSPGRRDGRTTLSTQLACSLARAGKRVLLVDASVHPSQLAWLFQLNPEPGLSEVLRGEMDLGQVIQATSFSRLWVLPAGHVDAQARSSLSQDWANHLFEPILGQVDVIVIDGPGFDSVAETSAWASRSQAVLLAIRANHTTLQAAYSASRQLDLLRAPVLGLVMLESGGATPLAEPSA